MFRSNSAPSSFFKSYAHSYTQDILNDIITQFMSYLKGNVSEEFQNWNIESERKKSHSTRFAKQSFVFGLDATLGPLKQFGVHFGCVGPPKWGVWGAAATALGMDMWWGGMMITF